MKTLLGHLSRLALPCALLATLAGAPTAEARIGAVDNVPAATLLLPYFEVDLANASGVSTLISINNASATAILAHVTMWSDLGVPTFAFNVYLTGYDVQTINLRDIFTGTVPRTASAGQDPTNTISPKGIFSQDINFASCSGQLPPPPLTADYIDHLQRSHTGLATPFFGGRCTGQALGDNIARGYVTIDTVNNCTLRVPGDVGYFISGGSGDATNQNVLWGDYFYINPAQNFAQGDSLVHIEASATNPETSVAGQYTFYGRYAAWTAADNREPLGARFATRFLNGGVFSGGTSLVVWRDPKVNQGSFVCPVIAGVRPLWYPLPQEDVYSFDEQERAENVITGPSVVPFGASSARVRVDGASLPVTPIFGWLYLNLNATVAAAGSNPPEDPAAAQAWVGNVMDASGRFSVGQQAAILTSAANTTGSHFCIATGGAPPCP
jgi:hypothetical protein